MHYLFLLGAPDAEMGYIERAAIAAGHHVAYAVDEDFQRVTPGKAYQALDFEHVSMPDEYDWDKLVTVECDGPVAVNLIDGQLARWVQVDHHNPGDPGYDAPPSAFWEGSSIGQVYDLIGKAPDHDARMIAASDHCPGHAYRGKCPGVSPTQLASFRVRTRARYTGTSILHLEHRIEEARAAIRNKVDKGAAIPHFRRPIPELPEASLRECRAVLYELSCDDGQKVGMLNGEPDQIRKWMDVTAPSWGLTGIYGAPNRGYAGGYRVV